MLKTGDKVICIDNYYLSYNSKLLLNKIYTIKSCDENYIGIEKETGYFRYRHDRFLSLSESRNKKLKKLENVQKR